MTETINQTIQPHQQRVIDEHAELDAKRKKLGEFFSTTVFKGLPEVEQGLLRAQFNAMNRYAAILSARIALFGVDVTHG